MRALFLLPALLIAGALPAQAVDMGGPVPAASPRSDHLALARQAIEQRDWDTAMKELQAAEKDAPRNADVQNLLGYTWRKRSGPDLAKAFEHYKLALKFNPRHKGAHEYIGEAYLMDRKPEEAERHLAELEKICGNRSCEEYQDLARSIADYKSRN